jgi:hypothetical protein
MAPSTPATKRDGVRFLDEVHCGFNGKSERRAACDVERQVSADIHPGHSHGGDGSQGKGTANWAETGEGGSTQRGGYASVPGQVSQPGRIAAPAAGAWKQDRWPGPAHHLLDQLSERPGCGAAGEEPARQLTVVRQPRHRSSSRAGAEGTQLHDNPGGRVNRVGQAVDRAERRRLARADAVPAHGHDRDQQRRNAHPEPGPGIGQSINE